MGGQLATSETILVSAAGVIAADSAGLSSVKSYSALLTSIAAMPLAGGTFTGNVLFTDNTYDIGASGATRPRTVYAGTSVITPLLNNTNAAALTLGNSTYGVTVPGNAHFGSGSVHTASKPILIEATGANASTNYAALEIRATSSNQYGPAIYFNGADQTGGKQWAMAVVGGRDGGTVGTFNIAVDLSYGTVLSVTPSRVLTIDGGGAFSGTVSHGVYTVATLPAAGSNAGKMAQVTDSNVAASGNYGATVTSGGANRVKVFSDGTNWVIA